MRGVTEGRHILSRWYAPVLSREQAETQLRRAQRDRRRALRYGRRGLAAYLRLMIARHALDIGTVADYRAARSAAGSNRRAQALVELIYGQLLISRRQIGAMAYLDRGFALARQRFAAPDYFLLRKRHGLLRRLPAVSGTRLPVSLRDLIAEALLIAHFAPVSMNTTPPSDPTDTLG